MNRLQEAFAENGGPVFTLIPGEYEGPLRVDRPCTVDGCGATLWAARGPVLVIAAPGVTVKNLRVEVTETAAADRPEITWNMRAGRKIWKAARG